MIHIYMHSMRIRCTYSSQHLSLWHGRCQTVHKDAHGLSCKVCPNLPAAKTIKSQRMHLLVLVQLHSLL